MSKDKPWKKLTKKDMMKYEKTIQEYPLENYPGYQGPGKPPRADILEKISYLDELEMIWGKRWGAQGIGRLREVAMVRPTEDEVSPLIAKDPAFFWFPYGLPNLEKWQEEHDRLVSNYKDAGVKIDWMKYPQHPWGPYGPIRWMTYTCEPLVVRGGAILPRYGNSPYVKGRNPYFLKFFAEIGCPVLYMVHGNGIWECGPSVFIIEDILVTHLSIAGNMEGIQQCMPVLERAGVKEVHIANVPGPVELFDWPSGGQMHTDMWIGPIDVGKVVIYPPLCGYQTVRWLREKGFKLIEIPADEQRDHLPANLVPIEPGKVIMSEGAKKTIKAVEKEGVEVIPSPCDEMQKAAGGLRCSSLPLIRDVGPGLEEIKR